MTSKEANDLKKLTKLYEQRRKIASTKRKRDDFINQAKDAINSEEAAVRVAEEDYELSDGTTARLVTFPADKLSKLPAGERMKREVSDKKAQFKNPSKMRQALTDLETEDPDAFRKLSQKNLSQEEFREELARIVVGKDLKKADPTKRKQSGQEIDNKARNTMRYEVLPAIGEATSLEAYANVDMNLELPPGTTKKVAEGGSRLTDQEMKALAAKSDISSYREDQGFKKAEKLNKWVDETLYFKLTEDQQKVLRSKSFGSLAGFRKDPLFQQR